MNDTLGHQTGDDLLRHVADRFARVTPSGDLLARLGGDEFGGCLTTTTPAVAEETARGLLAALTQPFALDGLTLRMEASIGIASFPIDGRDRSELMRFPIWRCITPSRIDWGSAAKRRRRVRQHGSRYS